MVRGVEETHSISVGSGFVSVNVFSVLAKRECSAVFYGMVDVPCRSENNR